MLLLKVQYIRNETDVDSNKCVRIFIGIGDKGKIIIFVILLFFIRLLRPIIEYALCI